jgi:hypothetical protein
MLEQEPSRYYMLKNLGGKWSIHENRNWVVRIKENLTEEEALAWLKLLKEN